MALPSFTDTYHKASYPAIDPSLPALSQAGKNIVVTGGGSGIGLEVVKSFAKASAAHISIIGRTKRTLLQTKAIVEAAYPSTKISAFVGDVTDASSVQKAFEGIGKEVGTVHVLVNNAGYFPDMVTFAKADLNEWNRGFEVNVKGSFNVIQAFIPLASQTAAVVNVSSGAAHIPPGKGNSSYQISKLANLSIFEHLQAEFPEWQVVNIHPGVVETDMEKKARESGFVFPHDDIELSGWYSVWAASPEAAFLKGRMAWSNWDVDELKAKMDTLGSNALTVGLISWP